MLAIVDVLVKSSWSLNESRFRAIVAAAVLIVLMLVMNWRNWSQLKAGK
jgi:hypothetical protein